MADFNSIINEAGSKDLAVQNFTRQDNKLKEAKIITLEQLRKQDAIKRNTNTESVVRDVTKHYLETLVVNLPDLADATSEEAERIHEEWCSLIAANFDLINGMRKVDKLRSLTVPNGMPGSIAAQIIMHTGDVRIMRTSGTQGYRLIMKHYHRNASTNYQWKWSGFWTIVDENDETTLLFKAFRLLCPLYEAKDKKAFLDKLRDAKGCFATQDNNLVFCRNGVWNFRDQSFTEYDDPDYDKKYPTQISLGKLPVYHPYGKAPAGKVAILEADGTVKEPVLRDRGDGTPWHPMQLFTDPFDMDSEVGKAASLIIQQMGQFLIRKRNSDHGFYHFWINASGAGRNMKSTITDAYMRLIRKTSFEPGDEDLGDMSDRIIAASVESLSDPYVLATNILTAYAIVGEESNGSVTYVDRASVAKMLARRQAMTFRGIYEKPFTFAYDGLLLQHSNKAPIFSEKNDSIISHVIVTPFERTFTHPRAYIKQDYINRDIVASYLVWLFTAGMPLINEYDEHAREVLDPYKREMLKASMTTFQFCDEVLSSIPLTIIPLELLYDLYIRWCDIRNVPTRGVVSERTFQEDMEQYGLNNDHQVLFDRNKLRVNKQELAVPCTALVDFGSSMKHGATIYRRPWTGQPTDEYHFNEKAFTNPKGNNKQFSRGCLVRTVPYFSMNYDNEDMKDLMTKDN